MKQILPQEKDRLKALQKLRYQPQLMSIPEDRALQYLMKDLEYRGEIHPLPPRDEDVLLALQKKFGVLPYLSDSDK